MLAHPHVVRFDDCFEDDENVYMVLELCENGVSGSTPIVSQSQEDELMFGFSDFSSAAIVDVYLRFLLTVIWTFLLNDHFNPAESDGPSASTETVHGT